MLILKQIAGKYHRFPLLQQLHQTVLGYFRKWSTRVLEYISLLATQTKLPVCPMEVGQKQHSNVDLQVSKSKLSALFINYSSMGEHIMPKFHTQFLQGCQT